MQMMIDRKRKIRFIVSCDQGTERTKEGKKKKHRQLTLFLSRITYTEQHHHHHHHHYDIQTNTFDLSSHKNSMID